ncbi:metallophosphoesterase [Hymenobacter sp. H14-R3]|uniref:metallophosphoesterase n=1 Tax=Hymenobacter sp. H14-R3 TaxID=3046308 RepID=UPI0024BA677E|nr:metallophosphoesterase [Hymenobacter sp. H14-R3]MDJ0367530.1 metallophosphoesterase [Hymenobacter sp. H14-R3]
MKLLLRLFCCLSLLAALPHVAHAQLEELGEAGESDFNPINPKPNYRRTAVGWEKNLPPDSARIRYSVFLIGDVGNPVLAEKGGEPSLNFMRRQMLQAGSKSAVVYLGDNIYNQGMPPEGAYDRKTAEGRLNAQLDVLKGYQGEKYMVPGNHDWIQGYKGGLAQVNREQAYAEHYLAQDSAQFSYTGDFLVPRNGCPGPYEIRLRDDLVMIALNSQWFITEQANRPFGDACGADTEEEVYAQLEEVIRRNQDKHILIVAHHPLFSDGIHGGYFTFADHVFPLSIVQKYAFLPLPIIGSIYPLARKYGGISQDIAYPAYQSYKQSLRDLFSRYPNVVYANGHEHNLQYYDDPQSQAHFITSGSGCKTQHVKPGAGGDALFSDKEKGFARLNYYDDGQVWVEYLIPSDANQGQTARRVYRRQVYATLGRGQATASGPGGEVSKKDKAQDKQNQEDRTDEATTTVAGQPNGAPVVTSTAKRPNYKDSTVTVAVNPAYNQHGKFHNWLLGEHYRREWATPVAFPILDIKTAEGGLIPYKTGGGKQTASLKVRNEDGYYYTLRGIDKDPTAVLPEGFRTGLALAVLQDQISAQHPYASFVLPPLAKAAGILHTSPEYVYIPNDPALGQYQQKFANTPAALEEDAKGSQDQDAELAFSKKLVSTNKMLENLLEDNDNQVDQPAFARSRLFDMWIGDWDRHEDQWRWAQHKTDDGDKVYTAVPEDRDIAFFKGDGVLPSLISKKFAVRNFQNFGYTYGDYKGLNQTGLSNDRLYLSGVSREEWVKQATIMQAQLTDAVIEKAFADKWPKQIYAAHGAEIVAKLKSRRALLPDVAAKYADLMADIVEVRGSQKREKFTVTRLPDHQTHVVMQKISKKGKLSKVLYDRTFDRVTDEIRLYGISGQDVYDLRGDERQGHKIRIIGGTSRDTIVDDSRVYGVRHRTQIYDADTGNVIVNKRGEARLRLEPGIDVSRYDHPHRFDLKDYRLNYTGPALFFGYNIDDGVLLGGGITHRRYAFRREPFGSEQTLTANFAPARQAYNLRYVGQFTSVFGGKTNLHVAAQYYGPQLLYNFFGIGNNTQNYAVENQDEATNRSVNGAYRVRFNRLYVAPTLERQLFTFGKVGFGPQYERFRVENDQIGTVIRDSIGTDLENRRFGIRSSDFRANTYLGALVYLDFGAQSSPKDPRIGIQWHNEAQYNFQLNNEKLTYGRLSSEIKAYLTPNFPFRITYAGRIGVQHNIGDYRFYQANTLGGTTNLRGYRRTRFAGRSSLYANFEARLHLFKFNAYLFPGTFGVLGLADAGRVYSDVDTRQGFSALHSGFGGGAFVNLLDQAVINVTYSVGEERLVYVGFDFLF